MINEQEIYSYKSSFSKGKWEGIMSNYTVEVGLSEKF